MPSSFGLWFWCMGGKKYYPCRVICVDVRVCGLCCDIILLGSSNAHTWIDSEVLLLLLLNVKQTSIYITHSELPLSFIFHLNESDIHALVLSAHNSMPFFSKHFTPLHFTSLVFGWRLLQTSSDVCQSERLFSRNCMEGLVDADLPAEWHCLCVCVSYSLELRSIFKAHIY